MALRAVKHKFTGATTPISAYDGAKTNLGSLIVQKTGATYLDKYVGPLPIGITLPMQEVVHTGNVVTVTATVVTGSGTSFTATMTGMSIGFGSNDPAKVTTWYTLGAWTSATVIAITSGPTIASGTTPFVIVANAPMMYPHVITYDATTDWVFLIENLATAVAPRKVFLYEYNKITSTYNWIGFIIITLLSTANANTIRGFRALKYLHTTGTASVSTTTVTGLNTKWISEKIAVGARIGFGSTDPTQITNWYVISAINSETEIVIATSAGNINIGSYVIEELRFVFTITQATTLTNGGLFLVKGINYSDFVKISTAATTIPVATSTDNIKAVYWLADAGTSTNVVSNTSSCGCAIQPEVNKGLHYAYVLDGSTTVVKVFRYNLRASGALSSGKMTMSVASYITGDVTVVDGVVAGNGTTFTSFMVGMKIGFGSTSPSLITVWYTIVSYTSGVSITLNDLTVNKVAGTSYVIDSADVISTATQLVTGTISAINNGRIGTLEHGPGKDEESLYFVTTSRIYRAALAKIYAGNLDWISDNRPEIPTGGVASFPLTSTLNVVEIADNMDRLIVLSTGASGSRNYVTKYPNVAGEPFDHIWGIDEKQQDQAWALGGAYISSGTVTVASGVVTGVRTFFTVAMVGFRIGFGSTDPTQISSWYTIASFTSITSITLTNLTVNTGSGSAYVIDFNSGTFPHFSTSSQSTTIWSQNGIAHIVKHGTTSALSQLYALPLSAHCTTAKETNQRVITPALYTSDCAKFLRVMVVDQNRMGSGEFSVSPEPWKIYFRTKGIDSNTGEWTEVEKDGSLYGLSSSRFIQFMLEFVTIGLSSIPARIMSLTVVYDDTLAVTDSHYQPSMAKSNATNRQFAWRFATAFGDTVPILRIRLYNAVNGNLLIDDYTTGNGGVWEKSTDGVSWGAYNTTDKGNETTYIRYTPNSLYGNIKVRAVLTQ